MRCQDPPHNILVDCNAKRQDDLIRYPLICESGIAALHFDDGMNHFL